jgi:hypothetical protein
MGGAVVLPLGEAWRALRRFVTAAAKVVLPAMLCQRTKDIKASNSSSQGELESLKLPHALISIYSNITFK